MLNQLRPPSFPALLLAMLIAVLFSFPVAALFEARVDWITFVPAGALCAYGVIAIARLGVIEKAATLGVLAAVGLWFAIIVLFVRDGSDPDKVRQLGLTILLFGAASLACLNDRSVLKRLPLAFMILGGFALSLLILAPGQYQEGRVSFDDNNPIWMARTVGLLGLGAIALYLRDRTGLLFCIGVLAASVGGVVLTGSRGPLVGLMVCAGMMVLLTRGATRTNLILFGAFSAVALLVLGLGFVPLEQVRGLTFSAEDASSAIRIAMYDYTLRTISENPQGIGVGWFMFEGLTWPHNIFLEFYVEWGWFAGTSFALFTLVGTLGVFKLGGNYDLLKLLIVYELLNASLSGDVTSPRCLYALLMLGNVALAYRFIVGRSKSTPGSVVAMRPGQAQST